MEEWRDVPGFEGLYQINIDIPEGRCRSLNYRGTGKVREFSSKPKKREGRLYWSLSKDGKQTNRQAARWIAITFPEFVQNEWFPGAEIDHIDTNRLNNHPSNLRWVDRVGQMNNPLTRIHRSEAMKGKLINRPNQSKWVIKLSLNNEILHFYPSVHQAARENGMSRSKISECCSGKYKTSGGFMWKYAE